jgi:organic radical activating enzyme
VVVSDYFKSINSTKEKLDKVSPSFCLAKWLQVTIHLQNGHTHSCHHPDTHKIPLEELEKDPSALHNTQLKKELRQQMLDGKRPAECDYCWNIEDTPGNHLSDRHIKSHDDWALPQLESVAKAPTAKSINPTYVEVSFSSVCNFKCAYCVPNVSTKWMEEIKKFGPYPTSQGFNNLSDLVKKDKMPLPVDQENPYVDAFWKWWPDLYKDLKVFRITGGEPLLTKNTFEILEFVNKNPRKDLELAINSNLGVPFGLIEKFATLAEPLVEQDKLKSFTIYTSVDTFGEQAEYLRDGLDYDYFINNVEYLLKRIKKLQIVFMCTYNALSVVNFGKLLQEVARLKLQYSGPERNYQSPVTLDIAYLRNPSFMSVKVLTPDFNQIQEENLRLMTQLCEGKPAHGRFYEFEIEKMSRLTDWMKTPSSEGWQKVARKDFHAYFAEYDRRRDKNFLKTFPEMKNFMEYCQSLGPPEVSAITF